MDELSFVRKQIFSDSLLYNIPGKEVAEAETLQAILLHPGARMP